MISIRVNYVINKNQLRRCSSAVVTRSINEAQQQMKQKIKKRQNEGPSSQFLDEPKKFEQIY
jgi:hypothetical protein